MGVSEKLFWAFALWPLIALMGAIVWLFVKTRNTKDRD